MIRRRQAAPDGSGGHAARWLKAWARRRDARVVGHNPWEVGIEAARAAGRHRLTGTAAEMAFYAVLGLVPLTVAFGAALAYLERLVGLGRIVEGQDAAILVIRTLIGSELTADAVAPFVRSQLVQERGGLAAGSLLVAFWLGSRMFTPALHALDLAYGVEEQRSEVRQRLLGLAFAVGSLGASVITLAIMIVGPLLGTAQDFADRLGLGRAFQLFWAIGRWPLLLLILIGFLVSFYRFAPVVRLSWKSCVPGALVAMAAWITVALSFRLYLAFGGRPGGGVSSEEEAIILVGRVVGAVIATMLWTFLSSITILFGGEVNAAVARGARKK